MNINKTQLQKVLEIVKPGLSNKEIIEHSTSFAFLNGKIVTYNDEISISHPIEGLEDLEGAVKAEELYSLLNRIKKDEIELSINEKSELIIKSGRMRAGLILHARIQLPLEDIGKIGRWKDVPEDFIHFLKLTVGSCGKDMSRPVLTCVHVNEGGFIEGSDGFKITRCELGETPKDLFTFLIPASSTRDVIRLNPNKMAKGNGWVHFKTDEGTIISCRTFADDYVETSPFLDVEGVTINLPRTTPEVLERAEVFSKRDHPSDESVEVTLSKRRMLVKSRSEYGWFEEEINIHYNDQPVSFLIIPYLLKNILTEVTSCVLSENRMKFEGSGWACVVMLKETIEE